MLTFKELLKDCSPDEIIKYLETDDVQEYKDFYNKLISMDAVDTGTVFIGINYDGCGKTENQVAAYKEDDLKKAIADVPEISKLSFDDVNKLDGETAIEKSFAKVLPEPVMYECAPWKEVIGFKVNRENVQDYGLTAFVADVMFKMVFFSFDEEEIAEIRDVISVSMAQIDEVRSMDEKEKEKHIFSAERSASYFSFQDNRPEEEKIEDVYDAARGTVKNLIREYETVCNVLGTV